LIKQYKIEIKGLPYEPQIKVYCKKFLFWQYVTCFTTIEDAERFIEIRKDLETRAK